MGLRKIDRMYFAHDGSTVRFLSDGADVVAEMSKFMRDIRKRRRLGMLCVKYLWSVA